MQIRIGRNSLSELRPILIHDMLSWREEVILFLGIFIPTSQYAIFICKSDQDLIFNLHENCYEVILKKRVDSQIGLTTENNYTNVLIGLNQV
jgi:hypothetical protein